VRFFAKFNVISPTTRIPAWSLIASAVTFSSWLPFVHLHSGYTQAQLQETLVAIGSVGCVLVWASQCLAFIRYNKWLWKHKDRLHGEHLAQFQRWPKIGFSSYAASIQPLPAYIGLISCLIIIFVLNSASMWNGEHLIFKSLTIYLAPAALLLIFIILKLVNRRKWVELGDWTALRGTLISLSDLIETPALIPPSINENGNAEPINGNIGLGGTNYGMPPTINHVVPRSTNYGMPPTANELLALQNQEILSSPVFASAGELHGDSLMENNPISSVSSRSPSGTEYFSNALPGRALSVPRS